MNYKFTAVFGLCSGRFSELLVYCSVCFVSFWKVPVNFWFTAVFVLCPGRFQ